jgi:hypothetical protein
MTAANAFSQSLGTFNIKPSILVIDKIKIDRAVTYDHVELDSVQHVDGSETKRWETERTYKSLEETQEANSVYQKARYRIRSVCMKTDVGFVCPQTRIRELAAAIDEARVMADEANSRFSYCHIKFRVVCTKLEPGDPDHTEALREAIVEQTTAIKDALENFDASKARQLISASKHMVGVIADPTTKASLESMRDEASALAKEMARVTKEFDGNVMNAVCSADGKSILKRVKAPWNV